jgi:hypothetical protein
MPTATILGAEDLSHFGSTSGRGGRYASGLYGANAFRLDEYGLAPRSTMGQLFAFDPNGSTGGNFFAPYNGTGATGPHFYLYLNGSHNVELRASNGSTILATGSATILTTGYTHYEVVFTIGTSGSVKVYVGGSATPDINASAVSVTYPSSDNLVRSWHYPWGSGVAFCDICFTDGAAQLGDRGVWYVAPGSAGTYSAGTAVGAGTLLACVDDLGSNDDGDYAQLANTSLPRKISFNATLPTCTSVDALIANARGRKDDGGTNSGRSLVISGVTENDGGADVALSTSYGTTYNAQRRILTDDPNNPGNPFTSGQAIEIGYARTV